jgi:hypothetical protein
MDSALTNHLNQFKQLIPVQHQVQQIMNKTQAPYRFLVRAYFLVNLSVEITLFNLF